MLEKVQEWDEQWSLRINGHEFGTVVSNIFIYFTHIGSVIPWIVISILLFMFKQDELAVIQLSAVVMFGRLMPSMPVVGSIIRGGITTGQAAVMTISDGI